MRVLTAVLHVRHADTATVWTEQLFVFSQLTVDVSCLGWNCVWICLLPALPIPADMCAVRLFSAAAVFCVDRMICQ